jgi:hypothetical protein
VKVPVPELEARLLTVVEAEVRLYAELRDVLQEERDHIVNLDATKLEDCVRRKESLASEATILEESRLELATALGAALGLPDARPRLSLLCEHLPAESGALREAHSRLVARIGAVRELLDANAAFAGDALAQVRATLELLGRLLPAEPTYQPGAVPGPPGAAAGRLLRRTA